MASQLEKVFSADPKSVHELFLSKGTAGFYIPAYQRHYSWDDSNIQRLIEDMCSGISTFLDHDDAITFIGTVISISDTDFKTIKPYVVGELPSEVMSIIDGQQRVTTLSLLSTCLYQEMSMLLIKCKSLDSMEENWFKNAFSPILNRLKMIFEVDKWSSDPKFRYYPKVARAYLDQWATTEDKAFYNSPVASYTFGFINYIHGFENDLPNKKYSHSYSASIPEEQLPKHKRVIDNVSSISSYINKILKGDDSFQFPDLNVFSKNSDSQKRLIGNIIPDSIVSMLEMELDGEKMRFSVAKALRLLIITNFYLDRVAVTSVVATNETYAFDMFEALNTTGEPLTAFETFKPKVVDFEGVENYEGSQSRVYIDKIDDILDKYKKAEEKQKATTRLLIPFRLAFEGEPLSKHLSEQRRFINRAFDDLSSDNKRRSFTHELSTLAYFLDNVWPETKSSLPVLNYSSPRKTETLLILNVLRESNHHITVPLIFRFYSLMEQNRFSEESVTTFEDSVRAIVAFFILWRGSRNGTQGIDACYRELMKLGIEGIIPPLCLKETADLTDISISQLKTAFLHFLKNNKSVPISCEKDWIDRALKAHAYTNSKPLSRLMLLLSSHNTVPSKEFGLVEESVSGINELLNLDKWNQFSTLEHIYPQTPGDGWDESLTNITSEHVIGNLVLLPVDVNASLGNSGWNKKSLLYRVISATTNETREKLINEAKLEGFDLGDTTKKLVMSKEHMPQLVSISQVETWSSNIVDARSRNILSLVWRRLQPWLQSED
ncbi:DUF262 domain-containing HNH endonuclease family protein [Vibrio diazotrophicus]|uniref:DUF262 domain-containing protein n=1 Tax=Vibrio diazotrophicus TaxID=685 RepID=UPI0022AE7C40|nr:DUF262 domain-containing HNH endonuclease family protein [Vibrio diazotrophicus]MCZ4373819.1 DUF262 domain-containing HNH endonuclease family protein [Vibrio diazotrophicus]